MAKRTKKSAQSVVSIAQPTPEEALKELVKKHAQLQRNSIRLSHMTRDRECPFTKKPIFSALSQTESGDALKLAKDISKHATTLERDMEKQLEQIPVYQEFLSKVWGIGVVTSAYLCAYVDVTRCVKPSQLVRYCGCAVDAKTGRIEYRSGAPKYKPGGEFDPAAGGTFNSSLRSKLYVAFVGLWKCKGKASADRPLGTNNKYLECWENAVNWRVTNGREKGAHTAGRYKATDLFLEDLYVIWRSIAGLPVWPDLYSAKRKYRHGGAPCVNEGVLMTLEEAKALVNIDSVAARPRSIPWPKKAEEESTPELEEAAE